MIKPRHTKSIPGLAGAKVFDFRGTGLCPGAKDSSGRFIRIKPLIMVEHIPVYPDKPGFEDFLGLADVLRAQGLHLQAATDGDGNVCLYNDLNVLCYQARGANQVSSGVEHMHMRIDQLWSRKQLCASAWLWVRAFRRHGIPMAGAKIRSGSPGTIRVLRGGHTSHRRVSIAAGYNDRSDPGPRYDWPFVKHAAEFYDRRGTFRGV